MGRKAKISGGRHGQKFWDEEKNSVGFKLMTKMGWTQGKGLGRRLHGRTDFVRAKKNKDNQGIGLKGNDELWKATTALYNDVLKRLGAAHSNGSKSTASTAESDAPKEFKQKNTTARVSAYLASKSLYSRFKHSKNTSMYSQEDLAAVMAGDHTAQTEASCESTKPDMKEYFLAKAAARKQKVECAQEAIYEHLRSISTNGRAGLGFGAAPEAPTIIEPQIEKATKTKKEKTKRKKKKKEKMKRTEVVQDKQESRRKRKKKDRKRSPAVAE